MTLPKIDKSCQNVILYEITQKGAKKVEQPFYYFLQVDEFLGVPYGSFEKKLSSRGMDKVLESVSGRYYLYRQVSNYEYTNFARTVRDFIKYHDWKRYPSGRYEKGFVYKYRQELFERKKKKHERIQALLLSIDRKYPSLVEAEGSPEFEELHKIYRRDYEKKGW